MRGPFEWVEARGIAADPVVVRHKDGSPSAGDVAHPATAAGRDEGPVPVRTFLIVDVRGYTRYTQTHGDEAAAQLASDFAAGARAAVSDHGGEVIELRGDEALAVFSSPRRAVRAAVEVQRRLRGAREGDTALPLGVGIGLDTGEAVPVEDGYRGKALNVAARLCSLAAPGETLATDTVVSLSGSVPGVRYVARRPVRAKGIEHPVRLHEVVPEGGLPALAPLEADGARSRRRVGNVAQHPVWGVLYSQLWVR